MYRSPRLWRCGGRGRRRSFGTQKMLAWCVLSYLWHKSQESAWDLSFLHAKNLERHQSIFWRIRVRFSLPVCSLKNIKLSKRKRRQIYYPLLFRAFVANILHWMSNSGVGSVREARDMIRLSSPSGKRPCIILRRACSPSGVGMLGYNDCTSKVKSSMLVGSRRSSKSRTRESESSRCCFCCWSIRYNL